MGQKIPRQSPRYSGRTAIDAKENVSEPRPPDDPDSPLAFSMEGDEGMPPSALIPRFWAPGWNSDQAVNKFQAEIGGALRGGDPGKRLLEPHSEAQPEFFSAVPPACEPHEGRLLLVPLHHIFGSEPLSAMSPGIAELSPRPYVAIHPADAAEQNIDAGEMVRIESEGINLELIAKFEVSLPRGAAGMPIGLPGMKRVDFPAWVAIKKTSPLAPPHNGEGVGGGVGDGM
jgi:NADH-quinone oxidoreductase subunit G